MLTYAIGDVHGRLDLLTPLLDAIERHRARRARSLVFLGDLIDRGPDSAGVVATVRNLQAREPEAVVCLMGNHEAMMLDAYQGTGRAGLWLANGGMAALASFGGSVPDDVLGWAAGLPTVHEDALRFYVHAGFRPGADAPDPDEHARLWIREPFLSSDYDFGKHVVHGHTPLATGQPDVRRHRTNLDTAAVFGGALTAGVFTQEAAQAAAFLQVRRADPDAGLRQP